MTDELAQSNAPLNLVVFIFVIRRRTTWRRLFARGLGIVNQKLYDDSTGFCGMAKNPVGAGLLANAILDSRLMLADTPLSRASSAPTGGVF
jgi:hypothetical protein